MGKEKKELKFLDSAKIYLRAGKGGDGCMSFRREKYIPYGGPDGGNGGAGGNIYIVASRGLSTLYPIARNPHYRAQDGKHGKGKKLYGKSGDDLFIKVPPGTVVKENGTIKADLRESGDIYLAARGGRGGRGNAAFKTIRNTAPKISEKGEPGEEKEVLLELSLLADIGLVGLPNAGKSTLLSILTKAKPKIADYPFTTLHPHLGVCEHKGTAFTIADIPGIIEGAHAGKGLGHVFLRHILRTKVLIHLVDPDGFSGIPPEKTLEMVESELALFHRSLSLKKKILAVSKSDLPGAEKVLKEIRKFRPEAEIFTISAVTGSGISELLDKTVECLSKMTDSPAPFSIQSDNPKPGETKIRKGFKVNVSEEGFEIISPNIEKIALMTNFSQEESVKRFHRILKFVGLEKELLKKGIREGDNVRLGNMEFTWSGDSPPASGRPRGKKGGKRRRRPQ